MSDDVLGVLLVVDRHDGASLQPDVVVSRVRGYGTWPTRPKALVTAPFRGEGMDTLNALADVVYDPWIEQVPLRLYDGEKLAARLLAEGADILIVESDFVKGPVFDLPLQSASVRAAATPTTSTSRPRPRPASRCCARRAATPTRSPSSRWR